MKLYSFHLSGHSHRVHLLLSLLHIEYETIEVDLRAGAQKTPEYLVMNRFGQVPVLVDEDLVVSDSNAILVYLARKYGHTSWLPDDPYAEAEVQRWLSVAAGEVTYGLAAARLITLFNAPRNPKEVIARSHAVLEVIDAELRERTWIAAAMPTIADVALYSYIAHAPEGNVDISSYVNVGRWLEAVEALDGFVALQRSAVGLQSTEHTKLIAKEQP
ncbi:glutathione S-transferase [Paraburkholderia strydomiana]|uniref:glutathione S-transferase family protein n=1 Tax=Paraburkholderia strydomiana TaxID=1245417 RepID=UPI0038BA515F